MKPDINSEISLCAVTVRSYETKGEWGREKKFLWEITRDVNKYSKLISVWYQVCIPLMEHAHAHIAPSSFTLTPPYLSRVHVSMLIYESSQASLLPLKLPVTLYLFIATICKSIFIPIMQRLSSDMQKHWEELHVSFVISSDSDMQRHQPHAGLWNFNSFSSEN